MSELALFRIYELVGELTEEETLQLAAYVWENLRADQQVSFLMLHEDKPSELPS